MTIKHSETSHRKDEILDSKSNQEELQQAQPNNTTNPDERAKDQGESTDSSIKSVTPNDAKGNEADDVLIKVTLKPLSGASIDVEVRTTCSFVCGKAPPCACV